MSEAIFYLNLGYQWVMPEVEGIGVCISAQGVHAPKVLERPTREALPAENLRIFDPQVYMRSLSYSDNESVAKRLATYPWINPEVTSYDHTVPVTVWADGLGSDIENNWPPSLPDPSLERGNLRDLIRSCLSLQSEFGVCGLILPSPLTSNPVTDYSTESTWIDIGLEAIPGDNKLPVYASLVISDTCLQRSEPPESELLKTIVDQITARTEIDGVYIVVEQAIAGSTSYLQDSLVAWSLLSLCHDLGVRSSLKVIVNYADVFGLACLAAGANAFCSGPTTKNRRLCFTDYLQRAGGGAHPKLYSHSLILDLLPRRDIEKKIVKARLFRYLDDDECKHSAELYDAIRAGKSVNDVGSWQERVNNTASSNRHYVERVKKATDSLLDSQDALSSVLGWLQDAERDTNYLDTRFDTDPLNADSRHVGAWRAAFENFLGQYSLLIS